LKFNQWHITDIRLSEVTNADDHFSLLAICYMQVYFKQRIIWI